MSSFIKRLMKKHAEKTVQHDNPHENGHSSRSKPKRKQMSRFFLIGPGEAGKTTIIKQMQKLCIDQPCSYSQWDETWESRIGDPLGEDVRRSYVQIVHQNTVKAIAVLIHQCALFDYQFTHPTSAKYAEEIMSLIENDVDAVHTLPIVIDAELAHKIVHLRHGDGEGPIARVLRRINEFTLPDSAEYFLRKATLERMAREDFIPTEDDMIRLRAPTTGQAEFNFIVNGMHMAVHDMGGQSSELQKLPQYFSTWLSKAEPTDVNFIWFIASLSDYSRHASTAYDQGPIIDSHGHTVTKLDEALNMFTLVCNENMTARCGMMVFLNKVDVFESRMIAYPQHLSQYYPDYSTPARKPKHNDKTYNAKLVKAASDFVMSMFSQVHEDSRRSAGHVSLFIKTTWAIDTTSMDSLFGAAIFQLMAPSSNNTPFA